MHIKGMLNIKKYRRLSQPLAKMTGWNKSITLMQT